MMKINLQFETAWALKKAFSGGVEVTANLPHSESPTQKDLLICMLLFSYTLTSTHFLSVLRIRIRIHRILMFLGLPDSDLLVRDTAPDPDPSIIKQNSKKNLNSYCFVTSLKTDVNVPSKSV
jgi:hypothetical protein